MFHHLTFLAIIGVAVMLFVILRGSFHSYGMKPRRKRKIHEQKDKFPEVVDDIPEVWADEESVDDQSATPPPPREAPKVPRQPPFDVILNNPRTLRQEAQTERYGMAGMSYDQRMKLHKRYPVVAEIAASGVHLKVTLGKEVEQIPIADLMTCSLEGEHFDIVAIHHEEQIILNDRPTIWKWNVFPQKTGVGKLTLVVSRKIKKGDNTGYHDEPVLERYASIHVDPLHETGRFMVKNWQWIAGTIVGSGVLWHFLGKGK